MNEKELVTFCRIFKIRSPMKMKMLKWIFAHKDEWFKPMTIIEELKLLRVEAYKTLVSFHKFRFLMKKTEEIGVNSTRIEYRVDKKNINEMIEEVITDLEKILMEIDPYV